MRLGALVLFVILATANAGGYRYGDGDQAFYQPATELRLHSELFPRDRALIESQARLTIVDEVLATASRVTRLDLPQLFFLLYLLTLTVTFLASAQLARVVGLSEAATAVFLTLLTLRHRIAKTGANTLEGYMHPRQLAFALGIFALTASFKRRWIPTVLFWTVAAAVHPTTALWWAVAIAASLVLTSRPSLVLTSRPSLVLTSRPSLVLTSRGRQRILMTLALVVLVVLVMGPMVARASGLLIMDEPWVRVLDNKDYLFASGWPVYAWVFNLAYLPLILIIGKLKNDARFAAPALALFAAFVCSYPFVESHMALAVQLQVSRVFWLMDFFLALLVAWLMVDSAFAARFHNAFGARLGGMRQVAIAAVLLLAVGRGVYTLQEASASRSVVQINLRADDWTEAMTWLRSQPADWLVMAHPDHAWLYGTSVRVSANRDVVVESVKDSAISMYARDVAMRTADRLSALAAYDTLNAQQAVALGQRYGATVAVTDTTHPLDLPLLHRNSTFAVYDLRGTRRDQVRGNGRDQER